MATFKNSSSDVRERLEFLLHEDTRSRQGARETQKPPQSTPVWTGLDSAVALAITLALVLTPVLANQFGLRDSLSNLPNLSSLVPSMPAIMPKFSTPITASNSLITGVVDPVTMTSSYYWTLNLKSNTGSQEEAEAAIALPEGAVVSRATLWVNGVPQEAAFNATRTVSTAYNNVAHPTRFTMGDPLLVTWLAPNKVNIMAAPVPTTGDMQIRLGITAPLQVDGNGRTRVTLPKLESANFKIEKQDVNIQSASELSSSQSFVRVERDSMGRSILRANTSADNLDDIVINATRPEGLRRVATRATHAGRPSYIVATLLNDDAGSRVELTKQDSQPACPILTSDHAAYRLSGLWAKQEIDRLLADSEIDKAIHVGTVYRVVSPVTGATVLEQNSQYEQNGLHRNRYMVLDNNATTRSAASAPEQYGASYSSGESYSSSSPSVSGGPLDAFSAGDAGGQITGSQTQSVDVGRSSMLQGALNGTIGPLSGDATVVHGVNTSGTERVNNMTNLEAMVNNFANFIQLAGILVGAALLSYVLLKRRAVTSFLGSRVQWTPFSQIVIAGLIVAIGVSTPECMNCLMGWARDLNLFS